ncbi:hypothetical protein [Mesorhizobium kowhaii]|uniref:Chromosome partitioning protein ParB n=1 Tax=Mesorhizobium kowhaii TaxID=1300272 RepID=A0A2W7C007_9HYPH|nr:hypothetical protein [Mesorhizobium kowhaii]PZV36415.1 hypothetical protein B5V02_21780 [Mesorhizobium kowhaii]
MNGRSSKRGFAARPISAEDWIKESEKAPDRSGEGPGFTARLTIDVTPELRGRIKIVAFQRGQTVADMLRDLLAREFPESQGDTP